VEPPPEVRLYRARVGGEAACVLGTIDHEDDLGFYFVATDPGHRGKGLASRLMAVALADARERGFSTSSLQASPMGQPVYERLGYEAHFRLNLYERRT
jgi:GNAT superfamily N-acetyltransferase